MSKLIAIKPEVEPFVYTSWQVNNFCNYRCSYCNEGNWKGDYRNEGLDDVLLPNLTKLVAHFEARGYKNFRFYFSGGEPSVWRSLIPVCEHLKNMLGERVSLGINTNLSRKIRWWQDNYHYFDDVVASYHPEFADKDNYFEVAEFLQDKLVYLCLRMMVVEERFEELLSVGDEVRQRLKNYALEWVPLYEELSVGTVPWKYNNPEITKFFEKNNFETKFGMPKPIGNLNFTSKEYYDDGTSRSLNSNRLVAENKNFFKGWTCNVSESIFINPKGFMSAASCGQGPKLGNIFQMFDINADNIICGKDYCHCGTDILITKHL